MTDPASHSHSDSHAHSQDRFLDVAGARLRYRDDGAGPALVFIHGWALDLDMWEPQAAILRGNLRIIRWDRRGFGLSSGRSSLADDVGDLHSLCEFLGIRQTAVVGMSQGTRVALPAASLYPQLISHLILDAPPLLDPTPADPSEVPLQNLRTLASTHGMAAFRTEWRKHPLARLRAGNALARDTVRRMIERYPGNDLIDATAPASSPAPPACPPRSLPQPVLLIGGELDTDTRRRATNELAQQFPHAERVRIPGAGHLCSLDYPQAYAAAIKNFLDRHPTAPRI